MQRDRAGVGAVGAEEQPRRLGAAGADQAGQREDLAVMQRERDVAHLVAARQVLDDEARFTPSARSRLVLRGGNS